MGTTKDIQLYVFQNHQLYETSGIAKGYASYFGQQMSMLNK